MGHGMHRVPIGGDTSKLPLAHGLTALERRLAWAQHFMARHLPGTQQVRQLMGHSHFGARVVFGDCIFFTISPNEQHSALVLRLSRFRENDPYVRAQSNGTQRLARQDWPGLERPAKKRRGESQQSACSGQSGEDDDTVTIELPEYDLRRAATARDPHATVEGYRVEIYLRLAAILGVRRICREILLMITVRTHLQPFFFCSSAHKRKAKQKESRFWFVTTFPVKVVPQVPSVQFRHWRTWVSRSLWFQYAPRRWRHGRSMSGQKWLEYEGVLNKVCNDVLDRLILTILKTIFSRTPFYSNPFCLLIRGMHALGGATEYQGNGTPHFHCEGHLVSAYQFGTMQEIADKFVQKKITLAQWKSFNTWLHHEDVFDAPAHNAFKEKVNTEFFDRFSAREHDGMSQVPCYLSADAESQSANTCRTVSDPESDAIVQEAIHADAEQWLADYKADLQFIFSRVQHHCHKRTKTGYVPLHACREKVKGKRPKGSVAKCKSGFPLSHLRTEKALLVCRGLAKRFRLRVSGRRNAFGAMVGKRCCEWQSGTAPAFAAVFRSNTHTLPNYRAPVLAATHEDEMCHSVACRKAMTDPKELKNMAKMSQRACRECCGYHSGYTFKRQPVGAKYIDAAAETLNYVNAKMKDKSGAQKYHYMSHRVLVDLQHRCMARVAPEEWNLAANWDEHDVTNAEFIRTYRSHDFFGGLLLRRLESELSASGDRCVKKLLPSVPADQAPEELYLRCFDDIYGFRGNGQGHSRQVYYLSPWEFLMWWECLPLPKPASGKVSDKAKKVAMYATGPYGPWPLTNRSGIPLSVSTKDGDYGPNLAAADTEVLFFPAEIPGPSNLHARWFLRRRRRVMVPAPKNTPMPDAEKDPEKKARLYGLYMRPWTLMAEWSSNSVPHLSNLAVVPTLQLPQGSVRRRLRCKSAGETPVVRSYAASWRWYIRGHVVSFHAQRIITQFMAANCGRSTSDNVDDGVDKEVRERDVPDNDISLLRVHSLIDRMSTSEKESSTKEQDIASSRSDFPADDPQDFDQLPSKDPQVSDLVKEALVTTGQLWSRAEMGTVPCEDVDKRQTCLPARVTAELAKAIAPKQRAKKKKPKQRKPCQEKAYTQWQEQRVQAWWHQLYHSKEPPTKDQERFLRSVENRCRTEKHELDAHMSSLASTTSGSSSSKFVDRCSLSEPLRACLFGIPGSGKSTCIRQLRSFFSEALGWEDGIDFQFLATQNTMAALIGGNTIHYWAGIPINTGAAQRKTNSHGGDGDVDALFERVLGIRWLVIDEASTASLTLLGLLDSYLRRACSRHPYARRGKLQMPFGGINLILAGDLWQLPPVRGKAIFSDPFHGGLTAEVRCVTNKEIIRFSVPSVFHFSS